LERAVHGLRRAAHPAQRPRSLPLSAEAASLPDCTSGTPMATLAESERALLAARLDSTGGNKSHAARRLGISRMKLYARISKYAL
jgi:DNA-binding NtrC family response regulator